MRQFEIRWASLPEPIGRRPVLLLTRTAAYAYLNKILIAEVTSTVREIPQEVSVGKPEGLSRASVVNLDNIHVVPKIRQHSVIGLAPFLLPGTVKSNELWVMCSIGPN